MEASGGDKRLGAVLNRQGGDLEERVLQHTKDKTADVGSCKGLGDPTWGMAALRRTCNISDVPRTTKTCSGRSGPPTGAPS